jgi:molybdopterin-guanine dinucleotide biosynthesis protein A
MKIAGLILAGGQGSRLGGVDKALLRLGGESLVARAVRRIGVPCAVSANGDAKRFSNLGVPVLADEFVGKGPLAGVLAGLRWAAAEFLLTVPVDTPFFPETLAGDLAPGPSVAVWGGRQHHLVALWPVGFAAELAGFLTAPGAYKVRDALTLCGARPVVFGGAADPFLNINTPADWDAAQAMLNES